MQALAAMPTRTPLPVHASWFSYSPTEALFLTVILLVVAAPLFWAGTRIRTPIAVDRPGRIVTAFLIAIWLLSILTFLVALHAYGIQMRETQLLFRPPSVKVGTFLYAAISFFVIVYLTRRHGWGVALASGFLGAAAAPMFFELPFDLIVIGKINPLIPPDPILYRELFFFPLFLVELSTIALLSALPPMRITKGATFALAGMFVIFAVWAAFGFGYPDRLLPLSLNVISKILAFVAATLLFTGNQQTHHAQGS
jgi:hypothetical protein